MNSVLGVEHSLWLLGAQSGAAWHYFLWGGLASLLVAPAILARTRWSESRPLAICVTLSVFAHMLFMTYAYATRLPYAEFPHPGPGDGDGPIISLNLFGDDVEPNGGEPMFTSVTETTDSPQDATQQTPSEMAANADEPREKSPAEKPEQEPPPEPTSSVPPPELIEAEPLPPIEPIPPVPVTADSARGEDETPAKTELPEPAASTRGSSSPATADTVEIDPDPRMIEEVPPTVRAADQQPVPQLYRNRMTRSHLALALRYGGNAKTEAAVREALGWIASNQAADGRWDPTLHGAGKENRLLGQDRGGAGAHADTGITALALLALLGSGHTHLDGHYRENVQHGLEFLLRNQRPDGELGGSAELFARMYCHSMATLALGEAYGMTGDQRIRPYLERAVKFSLSAQDPTTGGWRYRPGDSGDMSQFGWQVMSLKSAQLSNIDVPDRTRNGMVHFLELCSSGPARGHASYRPNERPSRTMTAEALVCRMFVGSYRDEQLKEAEAFIREELPQGGKENFYYWYYGTLAMFQIQGDGWRTWNEALQKELLTRQRTDGNLAGSWDPDAMWGSYGGRVFSTALGALCLEVYYRYLPLYQTAHAGNGAAARR